MRCDQSRVLLSARLDGEATADELAALDRHLARCPSCRHVAADLEAVDRATRLAPALAVPDLTGPIMAAHTGPADPVRRATRWSLVVVAVAQLLVALPALFTSGADDAVHVTREVGGWSAALAVGLLVAAWQPARARGMLPLGFALAGVLTLSAVVDVAQGTTGGAGEAVHLLELAGIGLLWLLARHEATPARAVLAR